MFMNPRTPFIPAPPPSPRSDHPAYRVKHPAAASGNNIAQPEWGSVGQKQLRAVTVANYSDGVSTPPGDDRPTPREVLSEVFLSTPPSSSATSALFVGWGLLVGYDLCLNEDNASEPLNIDCNNVPLVDVWCPLGSRSESISFNRSRGEIDTERGGTRSPINYATAYVDLDWLYGRDEDSATALRTLESGYLNLTAEELPHLLPDGTWLVADQRPTTIPVTFALMTLLLREHNRCCDIYAPLWDADTDEDAYQVCRQWTIAVFQHITLNDFDIRLVGGSVRLLGSAFYSALNDDDNDTVNNRRRRRRRRLRRLQENVPRNRSFYNSETNAGTDAVFSTVAIPTFYSALPSTVGLLDDNYDVIDEHEIELAMASADVAGLIERIGGIEPIIRGAAYSRTQAVDVSFVAEVSSSSPLFNHPVVAIQRGRDHGKHRRSYSSAADAARRVRGAYGFSKVTSFENITSDATVQGLLEGAYGDVDRLDAYTGALAENEDGSGLFVGPLLRAVFLEQLYRAISGDRHHHSHNTQNENAALATIRDLILNNALVSSISLDAFTAPGMVTAASCSSTELIENTCAQCISLRGLPHAGACRDYALRCVWRSFGAFSHIFRKQAIGFGGEGMTDTSDFVICVVSSESTAICTDHSATDRWVHWWVYGSDDTPVIYAWRSGEGIGKHPNGQRGDALVNFADATASSTCDDSTEYFGLHGALLLCVWMLIAPYGIYQARYRKGQLSLTGNLWWEMHAECMIICAEALLPLAITAIFITGGPHNSQHAKWGFYMIGAIVLQIATGWSRSRAILAKGNNFSLFHRVNKHFHIYAGWFAYIAGLVQCYRGLELVSGADKLVFSAVYINFTMGNFEIVRSTLFPIWLAVVPVFFIALETRKQFHRYFAKGAASICGVVAIINEEFSDEALKKEVEDRLMPRTEELPLYTTQEFNDKVLHGRTWVIVDAAVIDVSSFVKRHPGGARLIMNAMGTDVTSEMIGEDASIGNSNMAFAPHPHTDTALEIARSLVVGYIEEEDDIDTDMSDEDEDGDVNSSGTDLESSDRQYSRMAHQLSYLSGADGNSIEKRASAEAAAIVNASSPPPKAPSPSKAPKRVDRRAAVGAEFGVGPRPDRPVKATRRVREKKNQLDLFHVCPLLMHENMGDEAARPVYKFVFACPGRAAALVSAMTGVCHFHMRVAQEAGMTVVQRSYNAFAVRVVPASLSSEGELCIEMRIRIYPDGAMSNLLLQLVKTFDNPAVQLKGPFLLDRLIPPPAHRNIVMIAAGTGVNPRTCLERALPTHGSTFEVENRPIRPDSYLRPSPGNMERWKRRPRWFLLRRGSCANHRSFGERATAREAIQVYTTGGHRPGRDESLLLSRNDQSCARNETPVLEHCFGAACTLDYVVVSGPAGFVFHAEGLLAELGIPPQAVVLLD
eukprot:jgi/Undpi1/737/HiC_scaffold_10.g04201.m1